MFVPGLARGPKRELGVTGAEPPPKRTRGAVAAGGGVVGEVRFDSAEGALQALCLDGAEVRGSVISVVVDGTSHDGTKVVVGSLPAGFQWQELKTIFSEHGNVLFANVQGARQPRPVAVVPGSCAAEVRFETAEEAAAAQAALDGGTVDGAAVSVRPDLSSKDGTKLLFLGLPAGTGWQDLKEFCGQFGRVAYARVAATAAAAPATPRPTGVVTYSPPAAFSVQRPQPAARPQPTVRPVTVAGVQPLARAAPVAASPQAEVRFTTPQHAQQAVMALNGSFLRGGQIFLQLDPMSQDGTRLVVHNVPPGVTWKELKEHFVNIGPVAFAQVKPPQTVAPAVPAAAAQRPLRPVAAVARGGFVGEVRFESPAGTQAACARMNGSALRGARIAVTADASSHDGTKLLVLGLPQITWQELKEHFSACGPVAYAKVQPVSGAAAPLAPGPFRSAPLQAGFTQAAGAGLAGEVRYESPQHALLAAQRLNGSLFAGSCISVQPSQGSQDGSKLSVFGIPANVSWQALKEHFSQLGPVAFVEVKRADGTSGAGGAATGSKAAKKQVLSEDAGMGEVRYTTPEQAQAALEQLSGSVLRGVEVSVQPDPTSQDASKILVSNLPAGLDWKELKEHFAQVGEVAFAGIFGPGEVRYESAESARSALEQLDGFVLEGGSAIKVRLDPESHDGTKLIVENLPATVRWQEMKDLFATLGKVAYASRAGCK